MSIALEIMAAARGWLIECYGDEEDDINDASDDRIRRAVERDYDGGWNQFVRDGHAYDPSCEL